MTQDKLPTAPIPDPQSINRILLIKFKHIGDVLLATPVIESLKARYPTASIDFLLHAETAHMVSSHPDVANVITFSRGKGKMFTVKLIYGLWRQGYDLTVDLSGGGDRGAIWSFLTGAKTRLGTRVLKGLAGKRFLYTHTLPIPNSRSHSVLRDLYLLSLLDIQPEKPNMAFHFEDEDQNKGKKLLAEAGISADVPYAVIHPTSRWMFKCSSDAMMAEVLDKLSTDYNLRTVITCGPDIKERDRLERIASLCKSEPLTFPGNLTLKELGAVLSGARVYIGVDTSISHMAAALNVPSLALFGPTGAYNWGPWPNGQDGEAYPARSGVQRAANGTHAVIQMDWDCIPCGKAGCDDSKISKCLTEITTDMVCLELDWLLKGE
jgi:heptosyltransferase III